MYSLPRFQIIAPLDYMYNQDLFYNQWWRNSAPNSRSALMTKYEKLKEEWYQVKVWHFEISNYTKLCDCFLFQLLPSLKLFKKQQNEH